MCISVFHANLNKFDLLGRSSFSAVTGEKSAATPQTGASCVVCRTRYWNFWVSVSKSSVLRERERERGDAAVLPAILQSSFQWLLRALFSTCTSSGKQVGTFGLISKVFYGQETPSGESAIRECGVNHQLLAVITKVAQWGTPSCSRPQPAKDNGVRDGRSNWLVATPHPHGQYPLSASCVVKIGAAQPHPRFDHATLQPSACEATTLPMWLLFYWSSLLHPPPHLWPFSEPLLLEN